MGRTSIHYKVKIVDQEFTSEEGVHFDQYAIVEKWIKQSKLSSQELGIPKHEDIYKLIDQKRPIDIRHCYLNDFSITDYRESRGIKNDAIVELHALNATNSFFDGEHDTDFSYVKFCGNKANFQACIFNKGSLRFEFSLCDSELCFRGANFFTEAINFRFSEFDNGDIDFSECIIDCLDLSFVNTNFGEGDVLFTQTNFEETNCHFQYAKFKKGNLNFDRAIFEGNLIDFRKIEFGEGKVDFRRVHFGNGSINFSESEFKDGKVNFRSSVFGNGEKHFEKISFGSGNVSFDNATFGSGLLSFYGTEVHTLSFVNSRLGGHCDFRISEADEIDLSYSIVKDILDVQAGEATVNLKSLKIVGVKNMGKIFISWEKNGAFQLINSQKSSSLESKAEQFNLLKESFRTNGKYDSEDLAYVAFKRNQMKAKLMQKKRQGRVSSVIGQLQYFSQWLIYDKAGLFATSPLRVFTSMIIVLTAFSLVYMILPSFAHADIVSSVGDPDHLNLFEKSFYHSAITFFTIGYGDYYPSGHVRWLSAVEGWSGVFMMSYFTVAFVRKILR